MEKKMTIDLRWEMDGSQLRFDRPKEVIRSDDILIQGNVYGVDLTGLTATLTARQILPDGTISAPAFTVESGVGGGITLTAIGTGASLYKVEAMIAGSNTSAFEPGTRFVFDIEFNTTTTPPIRRTVRGAFSLLQDFTVN